MNSNSNLVVCFGELMLRLDCPTGQRFQRTESLRTFFGGAEANVSVLLSQLGVPVRYITALPDNPIAEAAIDSLKSFGTDTQFIHRSGERIGIYFTENGNSIRPSKVIYDRAHSSFSILTPGIIDWNKVFDGASHFHWTGISAALTQNAADVCREALQIAKQKGLTISADMNYRSTLWNYGRHPSEIMPELLGYCDIITGDIDTADTYFGIKTPADLSIENKFRFCCEALLKKLPALKIIGMSFRGTNEVQQPTYQCAICMNQEIILTPVYTIPQTTDRIGSGDAFMGGLLSGFLQEQNAKQIIYTAAACGVLKHSMEGDFSIISIGEINQFIQSGPVNRIIR